MVEREKNFADRLLSQQSMNPELQEKYRKELKDMFEVKVEGGKKVVSIVVVSLRFIIGLFCLTLVFIIPEGHTAFRIIDAVAAVMLFAISGVGAYTIWKGTFKHRSHENYAAYSVFYGSLAISTVWILASGLNLGIPLSAAWTATPVLIIVLGSTRIIYNWIKQSEINTRVQMLNLECKLAELSEKLEKGGS